MTRDYENSDEITDARHFDIQNEVYDDDEFPSFVLPEDPMDGFSEIDAFIDGKIWDALPVMKQMQLIDELNAEVGDVTFLVDDNDVFASENRITLHYKINGHLPIGADASEDTAEDRDRRGILTAIVTFALSTLLSTILSQSFDRIIGDLFPTGV